MKHMRRNVCFGLVVALMVAFACSDLAALVHAENSIETEQKVYSTATVEDAFAEDRILVVMKNSASLEFKQFEKVDFSEISCRSVNNLTADIGEMMQSKVELLDQVARTGMMPADVNRDEIIEVDAGEYNQILCLELEEAGKENVLEAIEALEDREDVLYVGPDFEISACATTPNDAGYSQQWAATKIELPAAWDITTGSTSVVVGVLDSGINGTHPDLLTQIDVSLSREFTNGVEATLTSTTRDGIGHGTKVAGVIGARGNNGIGACGVCWKVTLVSLKVLRDTDGKGFASHLILALNYASRAGIDILNLSAGYAPRQYVDDENFYNAVFSSAMQNFPGLIVCSAGNENWNLDSDAMQYYPSDYNLDNVISVGAVTSNNVKHETSNYGKTTVHLFAPGQGIYTTTVAGGYSATFEETSSATPFVTGVAALLLSIKPSLTPAQLKEIILETVTPVSALEDYCVTGGIVNAYRALSHELAHNYTSVSQSSATQHLAYCSECQKNIAVNHNFLTRGTTSYCIECGYSVN